jgi:stearoyl-CoA desaturase (delta-9 desaturase)
MESTRKLVGVRFNIVCDKGCKKMKQLFYPREWFFILMQSLSAVALVYALFYPASVAYWLTAVLGYCLITCLGITVTFHRLLTHKSYTLVKPLEYLFTYFGNLGCTGSSVGWVFVHRTHHQHSDKPGDPHSPVILGPVGAIIGDYSGKFNKWMVKDIIKDPVHRFMHEYYILLVLATVGTIFIINPILAIYLFFIPVFLNTVASRLSNWIDHDPIFGSFKNDKDQSQNVWWWSYLTFGEGWHRNHHRNPGKFQIGQEWWQFDPGKYVIILLMKLGLASERNLSYN